MKMSKLNEEFIAQARRPMQMGKLPIEPQDADVPVIAVDKWRVTESPKMLVKTYRFRRPGDRDRFVTSLLMYESQVQHNATIIIEEGTVSLRLVTKNVDVITGLDKEYARFADTSWKDIVYCPDNDYGQQDHDSTGHFTSPDERDAQGSGT